jgi:hypothetical protein
VVEVAGKVGAVVEKAGGVYRIRYVDRFMDKEVVGGCCRRLHTCRSAVKVSYFYNGYDATQPLAAYIYFRSLDFTGLTQNRTSLSPVKYARNYLK